MSSIFNPNLGKNTFELGTGTNASTFEWDGVSNIIIDITGMVEFNSDENNTIIYEHKNGPYEGQKKDLKYF